MCQTRGFTVNCGQYQEPIFLVEQTDPYIFTIEYPSGSDWRYFVSQCYNNSHVCILRISIFRFIVNKDYPKPMVVFTGENPMLQYVSNSLFLGLQTCCDNY